MKQINYAEHRERLRDIYRIPDAWRDLGFEGMPSKSCRCPWREDRNPSFSIYDDGRKFKDHATGEDGEIFQFVKLSLDCGFKEAAQWIEGRKGISAQPSGTHKPTHSKPKSIRWPGELVTGTQATWQAFANLRGLTFAGVHALIHAGILRFVKIDGVKCFAITDETRRAGEIRRIDGKEFPKGKVFPLLGVDKTWLPGATFLPETRDTTPLFLTEGSTDFLAGFDAYSSYRRAGGKCSWLPLAVLGAGCKTLAPEIAERLSGRLVRLAPDGDEAGEKMGNHWGEMLAGMGCTVEVIEMPQGRDLRDMLEAGEIKPEEIFS
ncbi:CHC2 zinc finger domain-containing protein [Akkermansiaceae bacterium]|nr:CHC2 zinc finger domain-containing protein [Akkermansiaceae bacterium]